MSGSKTLNSSWAGLTKLSDLKKAFKEFQKFNTEVPKDIPKQVKPQPSRKPEKPTGSLDMTHHGIKKRKPGNCKFFYPICKKIFDLRREVNLHVSQKHPNFKYKCRYCSKAYLNYASKYKHQNSHGLFRHICKVCGKKFQFKKNLTIHNCIHTRRGLYRCPCCPQLYTTK